MKSRIRWLGGGSWAVMDQGLFAASNFVLSVLLARLLVPEAYGAFTVAYVLFWVSSSLHTALLTEPMMVFGPGRYRDCLSEYLGIVLCGHSAYAILSSIVLLLASLCAEYFGSGELFSALLGLAIAAPFILLQWLMRRACYIAFRPYLAALAGGQYMALVLGGIYVLDQRHWLSPLTAFVLMGLGSLFTGIWLALRLRVDRPSLRNRRLVREATRSHWNYGRWAAPTHAVGNIPENSAYLLLPLWGGLAASAAFRAVMNLVLPVLHGITAVSIFLLPSLVRSRGQDEFGHLMRLILLLLLTSSVAYWIVLGLFHGPLVAWLYGGQYEQYSNLLWLVGLVPLARTLESVFGAAVRALERPDYAFWAQALSAVVVLTVGLGLVIAWDVVGALVGYLISQMTLAGALVWLYLNSRRAILPSSQEEKVDREDQ
jgi:O-antigen/teichoic acid export membrane protein